MTLHRGYTFLYISLPSSAKQQREMTKIQSFIVEREHTAVNFLFSTWTATPSLQSQLPDYSATLDKLKELKLSRKKIEIFGSHFLK